MKLKAEVVAYSSVVGQSIMLLNEEGRVVGMLAVTSPNPTSDYKSTVQELAEFVAGRINA